VKGNSVHLDINLKKMVVVKHAHPIQLLMTMEFNATAQHVEQMKGYYKMGSVIHAMITKYFKMIKSLVRRKNAFTEKRSM